MDPQVILILILILILIHINTNANTIIYTNANTDANTNTNANTDTKELKMALDPTKIIKSAMFYGSSGSGIIVIITTIINITSFRMLIVKMKVNGTLLILASCR